MPEKPPDDRTLFALWRENRKLAPKKGDQRWISVYCDASLKKDPPQQGGGWGCWARDNTYRIVRSGPCPGWVEESHEAEMAGVFAAVHTAIVQLDSDTANCMVVKTDNRTVCEWFGWGQGNRGPVIPSKPECRDLVYRALKMAHDKDIFLVVTWVKGHQTKRNTQGYLNNHTDRLAGEARREGTKTYRKYPVHRKSNDT